MISTAMLRLLPWNKRPTPEEEHEMSELLTALESSQDRLDLASLEVDSCRRAYEQALARMRQAADERVEVGRRLSATRAGSRVWKRWSKRHRWGRHLSE